MSKKAVLKNAISYSILSETEGSCYVYELREKLGISKQVANYWLQKFKKAGWVTKLFQGHYEITDSGKTVLEAYEQKSDKNLVRLENMRYKFAIYEGLESLLKQQRWDKITDLNNVKVYHTVIEGFSVRVFAGKHNPSVEITCKKMSGVNIYEMMYEGKQWVEYIAEIIDKEHSVKLGIPIPTMQPEWAIPSEFAKVLMNKTNSSQIRTPVGVINKSKGRGYDLETRDIHLANKIFNLPYVVDEIANAVKRLQVTSTPGFLFL